MLDLYTFFYYYIKTEVLFLSLSLPDLSLYIDLLFLNKIIVLEELTHFLAGDNIKDIQDQFLNLL